MMVDGAVFGLWFMTYDIIRNAQCAQAVKTLHWQYVLQHAVQMDLEENPNTVSARRALNNECAPTFGHLPKCCAMNQQSTAVGVNSMIGILCLCIQSIVICCRKTIAVVLVKSSSRVNSGH